MARVTVEDCIDKVDSPYELVLVAKERATQLNAGIEPTLEKDNDKNTVISLREIADENIKVSDLAEIHLIVGEYIHTKKESEIYNCGYGQGYSVYDVLSAMKEILGFELTYELGPRRSGDIPYSVSDITKFKKKFNWNPKYNDLKYILLSAIKWEKNLNKK